MLKFMNIIHLMPSKSPLAINLICKLNNKIWNLSHALGYSAPENQS